ncbi:MAG: glycerol-3-phosphate dehydrogenase/oxidase [Acidimicrobiales bacterium]
MEAQPFDRHRSLLALGSEPFDVLVVGGGVTGCGVALDAATRGLRTALVEAADFGSGTSSRSSKLVHGGLRYLQQHDYHLVYEALHERQRLIRNAPHLVHPLPFLVPLFGREGVVSEGVAKAYSLALWLYDLTGGIRIGRRHRRISAGEALDHFPGLKADRLVASFLYWDAQADDARLTLALARTAAQHGAVAANYSPVVELVERDRRVAGARLADGTEVRASAVVNAGGVWSEDVARLAGAGAHIPVAIRPAKGVHIAVPAAKLPCDYAAVLPVPGDKRSIFVVPWAADEAQGPSSSGRYTYVGTTDTDYEGPLDDPGCSAEDVAYLLEAVNAWTSAGLTPADVTGTWAGLRPLISGERRARTADLSRRHQVIISPNGLVTVTGGKLTTYRRMAADTVDAVARHLRAGRRVPASTTASLRLLGASGTGDHAVARRHGAHGAPQKGDASDSSRDAGLSDVALAHLHGRHGSEATQVKALCRDDPSLAEPLLPGLPYLKAEAVYAVRSEMALTLDDVLSRRTRAAMLDHRVAAAGAADVAALIGPELGWDPAEAARQAASFVLQGQRRSPLPSARR